MASGIVSLGTPTTDANQNAVGFYDYSAFKFTTPAIGVTIDRIRGYVTEDSSLTSCVCKILNHNGTLNIPAAGSQVGGDSSGATQFDINTTTHWWFTSNKPLLSGSTTYWAVFNTTDANFVRLGETLGNPSGIWCRCDDGVSYLYPGSPSNVQTAHIQIDYTEGPVNYTATPSALNLTTGEPTQNVHIQILAALGLLSTNVHSPTLTIRNGHVSGTITDGPLGIGTRVVRITHDIPTPRIRDYLRSYEYTHEAKVDNDEV